MDKNDPVQLNLIFVQAKNQIVSGKHPATLEESAQLGALQLQIQYGNHEPDKHRPGFVKLVDFCPPEYRKDKDFEKRMYSEHKKLQGMKDLNAKFRYVQLCRSLKTYGVTFYLVAEKSKRNKMTPILLGINREKVMRVDVYSKEIVKAWPLTTLRRWAAAPNSFTLDFGDYADAYYSVQTTEGEAISHLLAGYIDLIVRKRKEGGRFGDEEQVAVTEDNIRPGKSGMAKIGGHAVGSAVEVDFAQQGFISGDGTDFGGKRIGKARQFADAGSVGTYSAAQQAIMHNINNAFTALQTANNEFSVFETMEYQGADHATINWRNKNIESAKEMMVSQIAAHLAAASSILIQTAVPDLVEMDFMAVGSNLSAMTANIPQITQSCRTIAGIQGRAQSENLVQPTRSLVESTNLLLENLQPIVGGSALDDPVARQNLMKYAMEIGKHGHQAVKSLGSTDITDPVADEVNEVAKSFMAAVGGWVNTGAKPVVAAATQNPSFLKAHQELMHLGNQAFTSADGVVAAVNVAVGTINYSVCQEQIRLGALKVRDALANFSKVAEPICDVSDPRLGQNLAGAAARVMEMMARLLDKLKNPHMAVDTSVADDFDNHYDDLMTATAKILGEGETNEMLLADAKSLAMNGSALVNALKLQSQKASVNLKYSSKSYSI